MNLKSILYLSIKNVFLKKVSYLKILVSCFLVFALAFIILFYSNSLSNSYSNYNNSYAEERIIRAFGVLDEEQINMIRSYKQVCGIAYGTTLSFDQSKALSITIEDNSYSFASSDKTISRSIFYKNSNSDESISKNYQIAIATKNNEEAIIYGNDIQNNNEILVLETLLEKLEISVNGDIIGKQITITDGEMLISANICGIINKNLLNCGMIRHSFICNKSSEVDISDNFFEISLSAVRGNKELYHYVNSIMNEQVGICFWLADYIEEKLIMMEGQEILCNNFLSVVCLIITTIIFVYISINQFYLLRKNSIYYGILKSSGVSNRNIFIIHLLELTFISGISLILALGFGIGLFFILKDVLSSVFYIEISFSIGIALGCFFAFLFCALALSFFITLYIYLKLLKKSTINLLKIN